MNAVHKDLSVHPKFCKLSIVVIGTTDSEIFGEDQGIICVGLDDCGSLCDCHETLA